MIAVRALLLLLSSYPATAQGFSTPAIEDQRVQTIQWQSDQPIRLSAAPGGSLLVILPASERASTITLGDERTFQIDVSSAADSLFITPLSENAFTSMTVLSDVRSYNFDLYADRGATAPYVVRLVIPSEPLPPQSPRAEQSAGVWKVRGDRNIRPVGITDDGVRTYLEWSAEQSLPAVFTVGPTGNEEVINGYMREGIFVIDRVHDTLVFRVDRKKATALRSEAAQ